MATSNVSTICFTCKEETTTYHCPGCTKQFCGDDLMKHRDELKSRFHEIEHQRNEFVQILNDQNKNGIIDHPLINEINHWEQKSIEKIRQTAQEQRQLVQKSIQGHVSQIQTELNSLTENMQRINKRKDFNEVVLDKLQIQLKELERQLNQPTHIEVKEDSSSTFINKLLIIIGSDQQTLNRHQLKSNIKWKQNAQTIAGGNGRGGKLNQLNCPQAIYVDRQQQSIYIAEYQNHRIVKWKLGENDGKTIASENGQGNRIDQLSSPADVIVDESSKSLLICDYGNKRIVRWSLENPNDKQIIIENIACSRVTIMENGDLFVSEWEKHTVKRWRKGETGEGTIVAGGNGKGNRLNQLNQPTYTYIDREETVYVSDFANYRVVKWMKGASEGIIAAGGKGAGSSLNQLYCPCGLIVNDVGDMLVSDFGNHRIMFWPSGSKEGQVVVGGNGIGTGSNQLSSPIGLSFDVKNNLYVVDSGNDRIQLFEVDKS